MNQPRGDQSHEHADVLVLLGEVREHVGRIEERVGMVQTTHDRFITREIADINDKLDKFQTSIGELFVTRAEFNAQFAPVKKFTELILGLILTALTLGILGTILNVSVN